MVASVVVMSGLFPGNTFQNKPGKELEEWR